MTNAAAPDNRPVPATSPPDFGPGTAATAVAESALGSTVSYAASAALGLQNCWQFGETPMQYWVQSGLIPPPKQCALQTQLLLPMQYVVHALFGEPLQ
jgi:hypothetical protein